MNLSAAWRHPAVRRVSKWLLLAAGAALAAAALLNLAVWLWWLRDPADDQRSRGVNALWAAHTWVGDPHTDDEYRALADHLRRHDISDVFFHAGPLEGDGSVPQERYAYADELLAAMDRYAPEIRAQAYLGQIEKRDGGPLDLGDEAVRAGIVDTARAFLDLGFEGIHYDIEPIFPGDDNFIDLLDRTRALTAPRGAVLSVALEQAEPAPGAGRLIGIVLRGYHDPSTGFLEDVAERVDQVTIMTYDTGLPADWLFGAHMAWQTERVLQAVGDRVTVFMGVPTYDEGAFMKFHAHAENLRTGVRGVRKGLGRVPETHSRNAGIALFAEWTTDDSEWETFAQDWLRE